MLEEDSDTHMAESGTQGTTDPQQLKERSVDSRSPIKSPGKQAPAHSPKANSTLRCQVNSAS